MKKTLLALLTLSCLQCSVSSAVFTWDHAGATNTWSTTGTDTNWQPGPVAWTDGNEAVFNTGADTSVTVAGTVIPTKITFGNWAATNFSLTGGTIGFGAATGVLDSTATATGAARISIASALTGTAGLTINAHGNMSTSGGGNAAYLQLSGNNTGLSGGITVNSGLLEMSAANALGSNAVTLNGGGLLNTASGAITKSNNIVVGSAGATLRNYGSSVTNYTGIISGTGNINFTDGGVNTFAGDNTFNGKVTLANTGVRLGINSDAALGAAPSAFTADAITLAGGSTLLNMTQATNATGGFSAGFDVNLHANRGIKLLGNAVIQVGYGKTFTVNGAISGTGNLDHTDGGTLALKGANNFTGILFNSAGTLALSGSNSYTYTHIRNSGSTLRLDADNTMPDAGYAVFWGGTNFNVNGRNETIGALTTGSSSDTNVTLNLGGTGSTGTLTITDNNLIATTFSGYSNATWHGKITGFGNLNYNHATATGGAVQWDIMNTTNDFTGNWTVSNGRLRVASDASLGNAANDITFDGAVVSTLNNQGGRSSMQVANGTSLTNGTGRTVSINNGKEGTFFVWSSTTHTIDGQVTGGGTLRKEDGGTLLLTNTANNYGGETRIVQGILRSGANEVIPDTSLVRLGTSDAAAPQLDLNGKTETVAGLSSVQPSNNALLTNGIVAGGGTLIIKNSAAQTFGGQITGTTALTKDGTAKQTLTGTTNNYTGATIVEEGELAILGSTTGSAYTIKDGGTLSGTGSIITSNQNVVFNSGAKLSPGASPGNLTFDTGSGQLDLTGAISGSASGALNWEIDSTPASSDLVTLTGTLNIGSGLLEWDDFQFTPGTITNGSVITLIDSTNTITGTLGSSVSGSLPGGLTGILQLDDANTNLVLRVVPEPGSAILATLSALAIASRRRRK